MNIQQECRQETWVIHLTGHLTAGPDCQALVDRVRLLLGRGAGPLCIDLTGVTCLDAAGLGALLRCLVRVENQRQCLRIRGLSPRVRTVLRVAGLERLLEEGTAPVPMLADIA